jgi:NAD(P)-dependent dehydrogenase (short-subunit alcohol dehydrogenase family)
VAAGRIDDGGVAAGRIVVITGGSSGIGLAAARTLAAAGDQVVLLGRNPAHLREAESLVPGSRTYQADFARLDDVRAVAKRLAADLPRIDVLVNNAGSLAGARPRTVDGLDYTMQVNHLGGFLLTYLLLEPLVCAAKPDVPARVITTASMAEAWGTLDVDRPGAPLRRHRLRWLGYGSSKQANVLFTVEAARRWTSLGIVATCFFPGLVRTRFGRTSPMFSLIRVIPGMVVPPDVGASTLVWLATDPAALVPGGYFAFRQEFGATPRSTDPDRARRLWDASMAAVGLASA